MFEPEFSDTENIPSTTSPPTDEAIVPITTEQVPVELPEVLSSPEEHVPFSLLATDTSMATTPATVEIKPEPDLIGHGMRVKKQPTRLPDYLATLLYNPPPSTTRYPLDNYLPSAQFSETYQAFLSVITLAIEPRSYAEAILDEKRRFAVTKEIDSLEEQGTWTVEVLPPGKKALGCKWVFKIKFRADGTIKRYKARLVVLGNHQTEGTNYNETFAPVAKMVTVRSFLQQMASLNWEVHQMDVHNAFLHGDLEEEVYMKFPPGFCTNDKTRVCRLIKSLYGLKQDPRSWFAKLGAALKEYGFEQNRSDYSLFVYAVAGVRLHVLVYVDYCWE